MMPALSSSKCVTSAERLHAHLVVFCPGYMGPVLGECRIGVRVYKDAPGTFAMAAFHKDCMHEHVALSNIATQLRLTRSAYCSAPNLLEVSRLAALIREEPDGE